MGVIPTGAVESASRHVVVDAETTLGNQVGWNSRRGMKVTQTLLYRGVPHRSVGNSSEGTSVLVKFQAVQKR